MASSNAGHFFKGMMFRQCLIFVSLAISLFVSGDTLADDNTSQHSNFFPELIFNESQQIDNLVRNWYTKQLSALEESSLYPPT